MEEAQFFFASLVTKGKYIFFVEIFFSIEQIRYISFCIEGNKGYPIHSNTKSVKIEHVLDSLSIYWEWFQLDQNQSFLGAQK